jgi:hypothetical protein
MWPAPAAASSLDEIFEVLDVPALIGADRDALDVLLQGRVDDLLDAAVVTRDGSPRRPGSAGSDA